MITGTSDVSGYETDATLGADHSVYIAIKGFNQQAIVNKIIQRKGQKTLGLTAVDDTSKRRYSSGLILLIDLSMDALSDELLDGRVTESVEPYHVATREGLLAFTSGDKLELIGQDGRRTLTNEWMAYLHTADFSDDGERVLVVSTGFDTVQELDLDSGERCWEWNGWDHGYTYSEQSGVHYVRDAEQGERLRAADPRANVIVVDDPMRWPREGLATQETPLNLNGAFYGRDGSILVTGYHRSDVFVLDRDGTHRCYELGLSHPHSFRPVMANFHEGYMVSDTGHGRLVLLDDRFAHVGTVDFSTLPANEQKKAGFGEWLQTVAVLDGPAGLVAAVDALRDGVHLVDPLNRRRRFIPNPPNWTIQTVSSMSADHAIMLLAEPV